MDPKGLDISRDIKNDDYDNKNNKEKNDEHGILGINLTAKNEK